jgi:hypothetical protein
MARIDHVGSSSRYGVRSIARTSAIDATRTRATVPRRRPSGHTLDMATPPLTGGRLENRWFTARDDRRLLVRPKCNKSGRAR